MPTLTGKTIGQLNFLSGVTSDTLIPVALSGSTYHINFSSTTNANQYLNAGNSNTAITINWALSQKFLMCPFMQSSSDFNDIEMIVTTVF